MLYICGCVLNCAIYLQKVFENIIKICSIVDEYKIIISYDESIDNSLEILYYYQNFLPIIILINQRERSCIRIKNISDARNSILHYIRNNNIESYKYFIMMDMDDVNTGNINIDILQNYLNNDTEWDSLSFNRDPYYDIWALSIDEYIFSCWHWSDIWINSMNIKNFMYDHISHILKNKNELIECYSAFNGLAIYKIDKFIDCNYDWNINNNYKLIDKKLMDQNVKALNNISFVIDEYNDDCIEKYITEYASKNIDFKTLTVKRFEDCEHRYFHLSAIKNNNAKIRISPLYLFT